MTKPSRVFVVQQPTSRNPSTGAIEPTMDLSPALAYGSLRFILRDSANPFRDLDATADEVDRVLSEEGFSSNDWLLLVGNPILIGVVAAIASSITGGLRMLQWSRQFHEYRPVEVVLFPEEEAA